MCHQDHKGSQRPTGPGSESRNKRDCDNTNKREVAGGRNNGRDCDIGDGMLRREVRVTRRSWRKSELRRLGRKTNILVIWWFYMDKSIQPHDLRY
jgi:hypothetical protein